DHGVCETPEVGEENARGFGHALVWHDLFAGARSRRRSRGSEDARTPLILAALLFEDAGAAQDALHGIVAFVAGILVHGFVALVHRLLGAPGLRVVDRILDGEFVMDLLVTDAAELFNDLALRAEDDLALTGLFGMDVHRLDHQRVALPPADGIAQPRLDRVRLV